ncbi:hypothetical protein SAMN04488094_101470 [Tropicimonas isoalkanivorans]|uniref:Alpha/beta hydrolase family protein n=2 Tax=Tropicimonas isoalkanivorans TaxID=441112 RepID=A0A1I1DV17_9RHOB|nr:hypothetical protein SAMN04488094_101470 [Tropicimonas isoalkanivorans]
MSEVAKEMTNIANPEALDALSALSERYVFALVPGFKNSGPEHWQSHWQNSTPFFTRITHSHWTHRDIHFWIDAIRRLLAEVEKPVILIGHSLGSLASACVIAEAHPRVAGGMLVAPAEPMRFEAEDQIPHAPLPRPTVLVASHNDTLISLSRTQGLAQNWQSDFVDLGDAGHINSESGFGRWPYGLTILADLVARIEDGAAAQG